MKLKYNVVYIKDYNAISYVIRLCYLSVKEVNVDVVMLMKSNINAFSSNVNE